MRWNGDFVNELSAQALDGSHRSQIVGITRYGDSRGNQADERSHGAARLQRVAATSKWLKNLEAYVACKNSDVFGIADSKIDVSDVCVVRSHDPKMVIRNEAARRFAGHNFDASQRDLAGIQRRRRDGKQLFFERRGHVDGATLADARVVDQSRSADAGGDGDGCWAVDGVDRVDGSVAEEGDVLEADAAFARVCDFG